MTPLRPRREAWYTETSIDPRAFTTKAFHIHVTSHNVFRFFGVSFTSTRLRDVLYEYSGVVQIRYVFERIYFLRKYRRIQRIYLVGPMYFPTRAAEVGVSAADPAGRGGGPWQADPASAQL